MPLLASSRAWEAPCPRSDLRPLREAVPRAGALSRDRAGGREVPALQAVHAARARLGRRVPKALRFGQGLQPLQRVVLDLPNALARDAERATDLLERERLMAEEPEAELDHPPLPF